MPLVIDQSGHTIQLKEKPTRIVSLVPSQTELLFDLGLEEEVVGITKFCIHPTEWFRNKTRIGGTKDVKLDRVSALAPDLIIANKEENVKAQIESLREIAPVWTSDISNLAESLEMITQIGAITQKELEAASIIEKIQTGFSKLEHQLIDQKKRSCIYLIWKDPYMSVGADTFIHDMMCRCQFTNLLADSTRYPEISLEKIQSLSPELIFLSSEPYPFKDKHIAELQAVLPTSKILLVDGEMFSWYGSRIMHAPAYFCGLWEAINSSSTSLKS